MFKNILKHIPKGITKNFGWKLLSIAIAFFFWWSVVSYDDPVKEVTFENIPVEKINEESVTDNDYAIEYIEGEFVEVTVKAKRTVLDALTNDDIHAFADISNLSITNAIDIEANIEANYESISVYPANMTVNIEGIISANKEVQYYFEGETAEDYIALDPIITPSVITVTGPESQVGLISSVVVPIPIDNATRDVTLYYTPDILDTQNDTVANIETNIDEVSVIVPIQLTKNVDVVFDTFDDVPIDYRLMNIEVDSNSVMIRGSEDEIAGIEEIIINDISLASITFDTSLDVYLEDYLPDSVHIYSEEKTAAVSIEVEPIIENEIQFISEDIDVRNIPEGYIFKFDTPETLSVSIRGIESDLDVITIDVLNPYISLTALEVGTQEVVVNYYIPYKVVVVSEDQYIEVTLEMEETLTETVPSDN